MWRVLSGDVWNPPERKDGWLKIDAYFRLKVSHHPYGYSRQLCPKEGSWSPWEGALKTFWKMLILRVSSGNIWNPPEREDGCLNTDARFRLTGSNHPYGYNRQLFHREGNQSPWEDASTTFWTCWFGEFWVEMSGTPQNATMVGLKSILTSDYLFLIILTIIIVKFAPRRGVDRPEKVPWRLSEKMLISRVSSGNIRNPLER